jgi:flagellar basal-body rod protein FlgC
MSLKTAFHIAAAGLSAQRTRMETVSSNLANVRTTRTPEGGPYRRLLPVFVAEPVPTAPEDPPQRLLHSVRVDRIVEGDEKPLLRFEPEHPDADERGFVAYPNIDPAREMVDMLSAVRSYEANITVVKSVRGMLRAALEILG